MMISVELSFYPLRDEYKPAILKLIADLKQETGIEVISNRISTQLFGEFDQVTGVLNRHMKTCFERYGSAIFVAKYIGSDRRPKNAN